MTTPLPEVPGCGGAAMARRPRGGAAAGPLLSRRLHAAGGDRRTKLQLIAKHVTPHNLDKLLELAESTSSKELERQMRGEAPIAETLMFVSVEHADLAVRYVNGDWSEIWRILPLIDRFVRAGGWAASVMELFLALCERAKASYPAEGLCHVAVPRARSVGASGIVRPLRLQSATWSSRHREARGAFGRK